MTDLMRVFRLLVPALVATLLAGCGDKPPAAALKRGDAAPAFRLTQVGGGAVSFPDDTRGQPVVIRFWADWCRYCEREMKDLDTIYQRRRAAGLRMLAVNVGQDPATVARFVGRLGISYPALLDESAATARRYGVTGLPTTFFVSGDGRVQTKLLGEADAQTFERLCAELQR
jgi:peroxiredoxin